MTQTRICYARRPTMTTAGTMTTESPWSVDPLPVGEAGEWIEMEWSGYSVLARYEWAGRSWRRAGGIHVDAGLRMARTGPLRWRRIDPPGGETP